MMKFFAVLALAVAAFTLGMQSRSAPQDQATRQEGVRYQLIPQTGGLVIRVNTHTGDMDAFLVGPRELVAESLAATKQYGAMQFIEVARSPREGEKR